MSEEHTVTIDRKAVEAALEVVRPSLQADGGDVSLVNIRDDGVVELQLQGACHGCPMAMITLKGGIERYLKQAVPGVKEVIAIDM
ncbi:NifU family protein [bacterium]|nr:NifU family protein [bacterium]